MVARIALLTLGTLLVSGIEYQKHEVELGKELSLSDVYGNVNATARRRATSRVNTIKSHAGAAIKGSRARHQYLSQRSQQTCRFPVDLLIIQDSTGSFEQNFRVTAQRTLPAMARDIPTEHPGSLFSMITFRDKPVPTLGEEDDDCVTVQAVGRSDPVDLAFYYENEHPGNGWDTPENQYGAIMVALKAQTLIPWHPNPIATPVIVLITDSRPHFEGDLQSSSHPEMLEWPSAGFDEDQLDEICTDHYYPSPEIVRDALWDGDVYMATIVVRPETFHGEAVAAWRWFNDFAGYPEDFVQICHDDEEGWEIQLDVILDMVEEMECEGYSSSTSTATPEVDKISESTGEGDLAATSSQSGDAGSTVLEHTGTDCECSGNEGCSCWHNPDIYLALFKKPKELDVHMRNENI